MGKKTSTRDDGYTHCGAVNSTTSVVLKRLIVVLLDITTDNWNPLPRTNLTPGIPAGRLFGNVVGHISVRGRCRVVEVVGIMVHSCRSHRGTELRWWMP